MFLSDDVDSAARRKEWAARGAPQARRVLRRSTTRLGALAQAAPRRFDAHCGGRVVDRRNTRRAWHTLKATNHRRAA
jgi:hypothetical protein